jgi:hypothetical protein
VDISESIDFSAIRANLLESNSSPASESRIGLPNPEDRQQDIYHEEGPRAPNGDARQMIRCESTFENYD